MNRNRISMSFLLALLLAGGSSALGSGRVPIDWCNLQHPPTQTLLVGQASDPIYGQVWIDGLTGQSGATPDLEAELGYGDDGTDPTTHPSWTWIAASFNADVGNNDEFQASFTVSTAGTYDYAYRYSHDGGAHTYGDLDGSGNGYSTAQAGHLTVLAETPTPGPTGTPEPLPTVNVWHIPSNNEPHISTMRNPAFPDTQDALIRFYCGGYPQGSIWSGWLHHRVQGSPSWSSTPFTFDTNEYGNEYWRADVPNGYSAGQMVEYILEMTGDPATTRTTYVYGDDFSSQVTDELTTAEAAPFQFEVAPAPTPGACQPINGWHIPGNTEPPGVTMRNPESVDTGTLFVYFYVGAYPQASLWEEGTDLFYRVNAGAWTSLDLAFDTHHGGNEYWRTSLENTFGQGDLVEYYLRLAGNPSTYDTTYVHDDGGSSVTTCQESEAQASPFSFTVQAAPTPEPTPACSPINAWHIPDQTEPPGVTMRNPLNVDAEDLYVYFYLGAHPQGSLWDEGTDLFLRVNGSAWWSTDLNWDVNHGANEYWMTAVANTYGPGDLVEYYFRAAGNPATADITYVHEVAGSSVVSCKESEAQAAPFSFAVAAAPTPAPTPACNPINAWHIPGNAEPTGVTMRNPVTVEDDDLYVYFYLGAYPQESLWEAGTSLVHRLNGGLWLTEPLAFDTNEGSNEYWIARLENTWSPGDLVEYFLRAAGNPSEVDTGYVYDDGGSSALTCDPAVARGSPFSFTVTAAPTPGPTPAPCNAINGWHIPSSNEPPVADITMRNPLQVGQDDLFVYFYLGAYPLYTLWDGGTDLFYRRAGETVWNQSDFNWDSHHQVGGSDNEYWMASFENVYLDGETVEYYLRAASNPAAYDVTYIYDDGGSSAATCDEATAQGSPFRFTLGEQGPVVPTLGGMGSFVLVMAGSLLLVRRRRCGRNP